MRASILTFSQTGNTLKVGISIGNGLLDKGFDVSYVNFLQRRKWKPDDADLIGIGCPVFENRPSEVMTDFLLNNNFNFNMKKAFVFITSGGSPAKSLWHLRNAVSHTGATVLGGIQVRGTCTYPSLFGIYPNRPNEMDTEYAKTFGLAIAANMMDGDILPDCFLINPNHGGRFYDTIGPWLNALKKKATPLPIYDPEECNLCRNCVNECPTESIKIENNYVRFQNTCIVCYRCWHVCPQNSISMKVSPGNGLLERLIYSERMERIFGDVKPNEDVGNNFYKDVLARKIKLTYSRKNPTSEYRYTQNFK